MNIKIMLYMNTIYILVGGRYFFWIWKDTLGTQRNGQIRWGRRGSYLCYMAIGFWPLLVSVPLVIAMLIYGISTFSLLGFSLYCLSTGFLYYFSGWRLIPRLYLVYGSSPYPSSTFIGFSQIASGLGVVVGLMLLTLTFGFPFNIITQTSLYRLCFILVFVLPVIVVTTRKLNHINQRINQEKSQIISKSRR